MRKEICTYGQTSPRTTAGTLPNGVWEPGHSTVSPWWCLAAVLTEDQNLMALDRGLTPPKPDQLLPAFPEF